MRLKGDDHGPSDIRSDQRQRQAYEAGFNVTPAVDAMADVRPNAHDDNMANAFPRLGETGSTQATNFERTSALELA